MPDPSAAITYGAIGALATTTTTLSGVLVWLMRRTWPVYRGVEQFLEDWRGLPARPGFPAIPGVPARLEAVEKSQEDMAAQLGVIGQAQAALAASQEQLAAAQEQKASAIQALTEQFDGLRHRMDVAHPEDPDPRSA